MTSANIKKRKYEEENRIFNVKWEEDYAFTVHENKPLCLICHRLLSQNKGSNEKCHHETNHKNFFKQVSTKIGSKKKLVN